MKAFKVILKIAAALAFIAGAVLLVAAYWEKLAALFSCRGELKEKAAALKEKLPTKQEMIRINPFRKAELKAEYADYADVT